MGFAQRTQRHRDINTDLYKSAAGNRGAFLFYGISIISHPITALST